MPDSAQARRTCRCESLTADAKKGIRVLPFYRSGVGRRGVDVAAQLASQVGDGGECVAGNDITLDFGEPEFELIQQRGIRGREMEADRGILLQELPHQRGFVRKAVFLFHVIHPPPGGSHCFSIRLLKHLVNNMS